MELETLGGETRWNDGLLVFSQHRGESGVGLDRRIQLVTQPQAQREVSRGLPDVVDEEPVAPAADVTLELVRGRNHRSW